jgi:hypothetical protein
VCTTQPGHSQDKGVQELMRAIVAQVEHGTNHNRFWIMKVSRKGIESHSLTRENPALTCTYLEGAW